MRRKPRRDSYPAKGRAAGADRRRSRLTSLPSGERADHADLPVNKEARVGLGELFKKASCPRPMTCEALELPHRPSPQHLIDETKDLLEETPFKRITGINCVAGQKQITRLDLL